VHEGPERRVVVGAFGSEELKAAARRESRAEDQRLMYVAATRAIARLYLPDLRTSGTTVQGSYAPLHDRLPTQGAHIVEMNTETASALAPAPGDLPPLARLPVITPGRALEPWRIRHRLTSYSRMKALEEKAEPAHDLAAAPSALDLPGGRHTGIFLHAVLERLPLASVRQETGFEAWRQREDVSRLFRSEAQHFAIEPIQRATAERVLYNALLCPLPVAGATIPSVSHVDRERRELEFLYAVRSNDRRQSYVKGFVDLLFEYQNRFYVLDWKSDVLVDYEPRTIAKHVTENYQLQADLYALGVTRALPGCDFAGALFLFLRGPVAHFIPHDPLALEAARRKLGEEVPV
jgi:exodeoxyribonuclease V beta subunit